ncbi:MAG: LysR family transcriptional regulator [Cyanobacteria bacterium J06627_28]
MAGKPAKHLKDKVKLSQLRALTAVADTSSFSEAALQLNVSQSTVSHSVAALEEALGIVLIHRGRQGASLTPVGDRICNQARQTLALIDAMGQEATRAKGIDGGKVRIAAYRSMASEVLPEVIAKLHATHPTIQISITEFDTNRKLCSELQEGKADFAIAEILDAPQFATFFIMEDPFIAILPPEQTFPTVLEWQHLRDQPLITSSSDCCRVLMPLLQRAQPPIEIDYFISNDSTAVSMSRQGLGVSILPKLAAQPIPPGVRTAQLPFNLARPLGVSWLKESLLTPAAYAFLDTFKGLYKDL